LASTSHLAMSNVGIGCNFPLLVEADVEVELNKLRSVQLQLQLQRQVFPFGVVTATEGRLVPLLRASRPTDWLKFSLWRFLRIRVHLPLLWGGEVYGWAYFSRPTNWLQFSLWRF
jgi:hypothetical protein